MKEYTVGIISDTHFPEEPDLPFEAIRRHFSGVDLILHAGDLVSLEVIERLKTVAPIEAVAGNMDHPVTRLRLGEKKAVSIGGISIGLVHKFPVTSEPKALAGALFSEPVAAVVFGHTHQPFNRVVENILLFNPGSPVRPCQNQSPSLGLLKVTADGRVAGTIIPL